MDCHAVSPIASRTVSTGMVCGVEQLYSAQRRMANRHPCVPILKYAIYTGNESAIRRIMGSRESLPSESRARMVFMA